MLLTVLIQSLFILLFYKPFNVFGQTLDLNEPASTDEEWPAAEMMKVGLISYIGLSKRC